MNAPNKCPKCGGSVFEPGFLFDRGDGNYASVSQWVAGIPVKYRWTGLHLDGCAKLDVITFRCQGCGFLESYAREG